MHIEISYLFYITNLDSTINKEGAQSSDNQVEDAGNNHEGIHCKAIKECRRTSKLKTKNVF